MKKALLLSFLFSLNIFDVSLNTVSLINPSDRIANFLESFIFKWNSGNNNSDFIAFEHTGNQSLIRIQANNVTNTPSSWAKDDTTIFSENSNPTTKITDPNFEQALIDLGFDSGNIDGFVPTTNITGVDTLRIPNKRITDLTGIEDFKALIYLNCSDNQLTSLNISANTSLVRLYCNNNRLTSLNLKNGYDITKMEKNVFNLACHIIGSCATYIDTRGNPDLACIETDNNRFIRAPWFRYDPSVIFTEDCSSIIITTSVTSIAPESATLNGNITYDGGSNIEERGFVYSLSSTAVLTIRSTDANVFQEVSSNTGAGVFFKNIMNLKESTTYYYTSYATNNNGTKYGVAKNFRTIPTGATYIPDSNFEQALIDLGIDSGSANGFVMTADIENISSLNISSSRDRELNITNLTGIENFKALTTLNCSGNQLTSLNISANTVLTTLNCNSNELTSLNLSTNIALTSLDCSFNDLTSLDFSTNIALTNLNCEFNDLTSLNCSTNIALTNLNCEFNDLTSLNFSANTNLMILNCGFNKFISLNVSKNIILTELYCNKNNLTSLNLSTNTALMNWLNFLIAM